MRGYIFKVPYPTDIYCTGCICVLFTGCICVLCTGCKVENIYLTV